MSTIRAGNQPALVVVDVQAGNTAAIWDAARIIRNVAHAVDRARGNDVPVIWVQHEGSDMPRDSAAWQIVPELTPIKGEARVYKRHESTFEDTTLEAHLARNGVTHIVLAGALTNWCIRATAYAALDRGYDLTLLKDSHSTASIDLPDGSKVDAAGIVSDLNLTMTWLSYPGRQNGTATAADVDFSSPGGTR
jgi:nicotinamidase-related amidase